MAHALQYSYSGLNRNLWIRRTIMDTIEKERRHETRIDFSERLFFQVTVPTNPWPPLGKGNSQRKERPSAQIRNVGRRGCCLIIDRPLEKFQVIKLNFPLPKVSSSIPTLAEVRWLEPELKQTRYKVGVRYLL